MPSTRPPKVRTFSTISSSARAVSSVASGRAGGTSAARSSAMRRRSHRRPEAGAGTTLGRAAAAAGGDGGALTTRGRATGRGAASRSRKPYRSMRARRVLREMPSSAAVREMFPRVWPSTSTRCSRIASSSETASGRAGVPVAGSPATPSASAVSSSEEDCSTARSITLDSSRTLPGQA